MRFLERIAVCQANYKKLHLQLSDYNRIFVMYDVQFRQGLFCVGAFISAWFLFYIYHAHAAVGIRWNPRKCLHFDVFSINPFNANPFYDCSLTLSVQLNSLTAGVAYIRVFIFY